MQYNRGSLGNYMPLLIVYLTPFLFLICFVILLAFKILKLFVRVISAIIRNHRRFLLEEAVLKEYLEIAKREPRNLIVELNYERNFCRA